MRNSAAKADIGRLGEFQNPEAENARGVILTEGSRIPIGNLNEG
jgi:hypothetical protein